MRLGDTNLVAEVEKDFTVYGEECKFGGARDDPIDTIHYAIFYYRHIRVP